MAATTPHTHGPEGKGQGKQKSKNAINICLQMWTRRTLCKGLQSGSVQPYRYFSVSAGPHGAMVDRLRTSICHRLVARGSHRSNTTGSSSTCAWNATTACNSATAGTAGQSVSGLLIAMDGVHRQRRRHPTAARHRRLDDRQWRSYTCLPTMVCTQVSATCTPKGR